MIGPLVCVRDFFNSSSSRQLRSKLVDPNKVAPEYRAAAEKRRAEQINMAECSHKADKAKVLPRDRTAWTNSERLDHRPHWTDRTGKTQLRCVKCNKIDPMKTDAVKWANSGLSGPTNAA
jgi:hypothetical protein